MSDESADSDEFYVPPAWEAEPSPVPGMSLGEYERIAQRILWFSAVSLEERLRSFVRHRKEQRRFDAMRILDREPGA